MIVPGLRVACEVVLPGACLAFNTEMVQCQCRELDKSPTLLISALPQHPNDYAALPANFGPRPRTVKMVRLQRLCLLRIHSSRSQCSLARGCSAGSMHPVSLRRYHEQPLFAIQSAAMPGFQPPAPQHSFLAA